MNRLRWTLATALFAALCVALLQPKSTQGQQILQYGFEARNPVWKADRADAAYKVLAHQLTEETAHGGLRSEHIQLRAEKGTYIHYVYKIGRAPLTEELNVGLWLKSTRPGIQLLCRLVLPRERDPNAVGQPLTVLVRCEPYQSTRWKLLTLNQPLKRLQEQQQLLQAQLGRDVITTDAYISELVLNVYDGPGQTDVWIDDLEVGPVFDNSTNPSSPSASGSTEAGQNPEQTPFPATPTANARASTVEMKGPHLLVNARRYFVRGIRHTGTPLRVLRDAGFNTVWMDESTPDGLVEDAVNLGFWLVPTIVPPKLPTDGRAEGLLTSNEAFSRKVARFMKQEAVLCWDLGSNLTAENFPEVARTARAFQVADPMRPVSADIWDGFPNYSRSLNQMMVGVHRWPLMTSLELESYREWLVQRRRLVAPGAFCWTWIQNHLPDWFLQASLTNAANKDPLGPLPEQVRLLTYLAIGCGYRGVSFWSDRSLADSQSGRDRLLGLALLNQELLMLEPILVEADANKEPEWIGTSRPEVRAAVIRTPKGVLVLPIWVGIGSQFVPGQAASSTLSLTVPLVPTTAQAWEISPGKVQAHKAERVLGGVQITLRNFSLTSAILFTSDLSPTGMVVRLQDQQRRMGRQAAQWAHHQAQEELGKVEHVQASLEKMGRAIPDSGALIKKAQEALTACIDHRRNGEHSEAYTDAQVALRALRLLMRLQWDQAVRNLDTPVASPYAVSYFTLPQHWELLDELRQLKPGDNLLPDGGFEAPPTQVAEGWMVQEVPSLDPVVAKAGRVKESPLEGKQCLMLGFDARLPVGSLERSFLALHSPLVKVKPGTLVRISAWVMTKGVGSTQDGALIYDSVGGEPLAVRIMATKGWRRYSLFRRVPESGTIRVTLATSGLGRVYFDDVRIEPLIPAGGIVPTRPDQASAQSPRGGQQNPTPLAEKTSQSRP